MKKIAALLSSMFAVSLLVTSGAFASSVYPTGSQGVDIGSPNCSTTVPKVAFGIVGVNDGIIYGHNACLSSEVANFVGPSLYINTALNASSNSPYYTSAQVGCSDSLCAAYNYGYNATKDAIAYATSQGVKSNQWWLDVEATNTWNSDVLQNQQSLQGSYDAIKATGATTIGVYSTTLQWQTITGSWKNGWPSWGATTFTTARQAQSYCTGHQFTGGPSLLMQFKSKQNKVDQDVAC
jgi:hypothetical protein